MLRKGRKERAGRKKTGVGERKEDQIIRQGMILGALTGIISFVLHKESVEICIIIPFYR